MTLIHGQTLNSKVVPVQVDDDGNLFIVLTGLYGGTMQRAPIPFGSSGAKFDVVTVGAVPAGTSNQDGGVVPAGEYWVITNISIIVATAIPAGQLDVIILSGGTNYTLWRISAPAAGVVYDRQGYWILDSGANVRYQIIGAPGGGAFKGSAVGFRVDTDQ